MCKVPREKERNRHQAKIYGPATVAPFNLILFDHLRHAP